MAGSRRHCYHRDGYGTSPFLLGSFNMLSKIFLQAVVDNQTDLKEQVIQVAERMSAVSTAVQVTRIPALFYGGIGGVVFSPAQFIFIKNFVDNSRARFSS
jgi:hypothetical protein